MLVREPDELGLEGRAPATGPRSIVPHGVQGSNQTLVEPGEVARRAPRVSDGEGFALDAAQRLIDTVGKGGSISKGTDTRTITPTSTN